MVKKEFIYGGKPHECYKIVPFVVSYTPLSEGVTICSKCLMAVYGPREKEVYCSPPLEPKP